MEQKLIGADEAEPQKPVKKKHTESVFFKFFGRFLVFLAVTLMVAAGALYGVMYVLAKGPSPTACSIFVNSVRETSAVGFLANLFFTEEEIVLMSAQENAVEYVETDTSLINIPTKPQDTEDGAPEGPAADEWGLIDDDSDGIIIEQVHGEGYSGYMMVVLDPSRVILGSVPWAYEKNGYTVEQMVTRFHAVAGINAGGFEDPGGNGDGSTPNTMIIYKGVSYYPEKGVQSGFVGLDRDHILHVGRFSAGSARKSGIQYGVGFGPVLISNGEPADPASLRSGVNPRTAIGQRSDGAILMLVIDGRQVISLGATYQDLTDIFLEYGAVNACNLDGGSSSLMWYDGEYVNNCASVIGIRAVPTAFLVLEKEETENG